MAPRRAVFLLALLLTVGCAARQASVQQAADLRTADELIRAGCFTCLRDALVLYERVAGARRAPPGVTQPLFDATILLTLRAKEIGLPFAPWLDRARTVARTLPSVAGADAVLELVDAVPPETSGFAPMPLVPRRPGRDGQPDVVAQRARVAGTALGEPAKRYLDLTLACGNLDTRAALAAEPPPPDPAALIRYRLATCFTMPTTEAGRLYENDPRWAEAAWFEGRRALGTSRDLTRALALLGTAANAFPDSGAMLMTLAGAQRAAGELNAALATYDAVLALVPEHRAGLLGRVLCLTYLNRHDEAITSATRMVDLGTHLMADAYYWRAWNRYQIKTLVPAWDDVTLALKLQTSTNVHTLAGLIAYARKELDTALTHFDRAWTLDSSNCNAGFYKGVVHSDLSQWPDAAPTFSGAMRCFIAAAAAARSELAALQASTQPEAFKARQGAEHEKTIAEADRQAAVSAYNSAQAYGRTGQKTTALSHLDIALGHVAIREKAEALKKLLSPP